MTRTPILAAAVLFFAATVPASAHSVPPDGRPDTDMRWGPFAIDEARVRDNLMPGAPSDGSTDSPATGSASFFYDRETDRLDYTVSWENLAGPLIHVRVHGPADAAHSTDDRLFDVLTDGVAVASAGVNRTTGSFSGTLDLQHPPDISCGCTDFDEEAAAQKIIGALLDGHAYLNLGTQAFPAGEIRGNFPFAAAVGAVDPGPSPNPIPLPPAVWPAIVTCAVFLALHAVRKARA